MGIASGIFWIMFGLIYIWYQAVKEHPSETITGTLLCILVVGGIILYTYTYRWLMEWNLWVGSIFAFCVLGFVCYKVIQSQIKERKKQEAIHEEYVAWMTKVRSTLTEQDYYNYAKDNWWFYNVSMDEKSCMYWKKEPYYTRICNALELKRSIEMKREEENQKKLSAE